MKRQFYVFKKLLIINCAALITFSSSAQISQLADSILINDSVISTGHIGISIYDATANAYLYNYNAAKYFVPASNTKLFTCYAGMKYLGDSLVGLKYTENNIINIDSITPITHLVKIFPTGDPTFLNNEFSFQPVFEFLKKQKLFEVCDFNDVAPYGKGWAWDDYMEEFMTPRSSFPVYKNIFTLRFVQKDSVKVQPEYFKKEIFSLKNTSDSGFSVSEYFLGNIIGLIPGKDREKKIPFCNESIVGILKDTLKKQYILGSSWLMGGEDLKRKYNIIHSQPTDSLLKPMMYNSDNFFAEQTLLMVSNEHLGYMNDENIIDTLLKTDLKDIPQKPIWVDGSGLSRYNLFTPQSFVYMLNKLKNEFGLKRLEVILPTGGEGTLKNYYQKDSAYIYAKTGSMSNIFCLSGYLITQKNKLLIFSIMANNFQGDTTPVRQAIEKLLNAVREKY